jgi:hypothetical protein
MDIVQKFKEELSEYELKEKGNTLSFKKVVAERKAFLSKKKLEYSGTIKVDLEEKSVVFSDMLKESGSGLSTGGDSGMSSGFGFSATTYSSGLKGRSGSIKEQSELFGKKYDYSFNYEEVREKIEGICKKEGYSFKYSIF